MGSTVGLFQVDVTYRSTMCTAVPYIDSLHNLKKIKVCLHHSGVLGGNKNSLVIERLPSQARDIHFQSEVEKT